MLSKPFSYHAKHPTLFWSGFLLLGLIFSEVFVWGQIRPRRPVRVAPEAQLMETHVYYVSLQATNGQYVIAQNDGEVNAKLRQAALLWVLFVLTDKNGGSLVSGDAVSLKTCSTGYYLSAEGGGGSRLLANQTAAGTNESFQITKIRGTAGTEIVVGDWIALRAANGPYVSAEGGGGGLVNAKANAVGPWESFLVSDRSAPGQFATPPTCAETPSIAPTASSTYPPGTAPPPASAPAPGQKSVPLKTYWHGGRGDNFATATSVGEQSAQGAGYQLVRTEAYVLWSPERWTVPLKLYWHPVREDTFTTATAAGEQSALAAGYQFIRVEGYVYPNPVVTGTLPLWLYWHEGRADNFVTATPEGARDAQAAGYRYIRTEGYVGAVTRVSDVTVYGPPVNTGLTVLPGSTIRIEAKGKVNFGGGVFGIGDPILDADGDPPNVATPSDYPAPSLRKNSLICVIADSLGNKTYYQGGTDKTFVADKSGALWLKPNDKEYADNKPAPYPDYGWKVTVYVTRPQ